jgi:hypothetical protein
MTTVVAWALLLGFVWLVLQAGLPAFRASVRAELERKRAKTGL